jgi:hypothetical protein
MLVRVYQNPDTTVRVVFPNPTQREEGESDADFAARIFAFTEERDPTLAGLPHVDVDEATLPDRDTRKAWRLQGGVVVADAAILQAAATAATEAAALRQQILDLAQSAVGVSLSALTTAQRNALIVGLLHKAGGVTNDMKVKPLADWLK